MKSECVTLEQDNNTMNQQIDVLNHHLNDQDNEILALQRQLDSILKDRDFLAVETSVKSLKLIYREMRRSLEIWVQT